MLVVVFAVVTSAYSKDFGASGKEVTKISNTGHQVQVWAVLPEYTEKANYEVKVKHAVEGDKGSFYIIAWADTNKDGKPDTEIGRSELKIAEKANDWSSWIFDSEYDKIFVGNTWKQSDEKIYYGHKIPEGYTGLSEEVYYSRKFNKAPVSTAKPRVTNIKVKIVSEKGSDFGIVGKEVTKISNTGHQVQVWKILPKFTKKGKYEVMIKHAVKGDKGSFYIIAWADTNKDGKPDKEIGRSELKTAEKANDWSSWIFESNYDKIFVGNTWKQSDEKVFYGHKIPEGYIGLSEDVYYSRKFNTAPVSTTKPRFTNIQVNIIPENK